MNRSHYLLRFRSHHSLRRPSWTSSSILDATNFRHMHGMLFQLLKKEEDLEISPFGKLKKSIDSSCLRQPSTSTFFDISFIKQFVVALMAIPFAERSHFYTRYASGLNRALVCTWGRQESNILVKDTVFYHQLMVRISVLRLAGVRDRIVNEDISMNLHTISRFRR